jgi:hypothetical protein
MGKPEVVCNPTAAVCLDRTASKVLAIVIRWRLEKIPQALGARTGLEFLDPL